MRRIALGTAQFGLPYGIANQGGQVSRSIAKDMLKLAEFKGMNTLDTAIAYGESERCLGEIGAQGFNIVTKLPEIPNGCVDIIEWVQDQVTVSLDKLKVKSVYGVLLHRSDQLLTTDGNILFQALCKLKQDGLAQKIGISIYSPSELDALIPRYQFDLIQAPFSLVDRRILLSGWLHKLNQEGVEIHTRSAFLQGLLLMPQSAIPLEFTAWDVLWEKWHKWLSCHDASAVQACLAYPLSFPGIDHVVVGVNSVSQLEQIIEAASCVAPNDLPDLCCEEESLINPVTWPR